MLLITTSISSPCSCNIHTEFTTDFASSGIALKPQQYAVETSPYRHNLIITGA